MYARATIHDFLGDFVVYRNLEPADSRLHGLRAVWSKISRSACRIPRKVEEDYAAVVVDFLVQAQALRGAKRSLAHLLYIGDTRLLDGTAYHNLKKKSGWPGWGFIAAEKQEDKPGVEIEDDIYLANRWGALSQFLEFVQDEGIPLDETTVAIIDLDKTVLGARGRNDKVIDEARLSGVRRTMQEVLQADFDEQKFRAAYSRLNQPAYHHFTADNQDYLAYICLMVTGGIYDEEELWADLEAGKLDRFATFVEACNRRMGTEQGGLLAVHREVYGNWRSGDPTPFKSFRRREYFETINRMDLLADDAGQELVLKSEIVLTGEVAAAACYLQERGVLCFGISDKPDEASLPTPELAAEGWPALHHARMKVLSGQKA
jgi:hypothetical protein